MSSSKSGGRKKRGRVGGQPLDDHLFTLHQRLRQALSMGLSVTGKTKKWDCIDAEVQRVAVRSISSFLSHLSAELLHSPFVQDTFGDIMVALEGILHTGNQTLLSLTAEVLVKYVDLLGDSILRYDCSVLIHTLSCLISSPRPSVAISCAISLNSILKKLKPWKVDDHKSAWQKLECTNAIDGILHGLLEYITGNEKPVDYFTQMASLLCTILWWWPSSRYSVWVWSNQNLTSRIGSLCRNLDSSISAVMLQVYAALALCGDLAMKLLESREPVAALVFCMEKSQPYSLRIEAFRLFQMLTKSEVGTTMIMQQYGTSVVRSITRAMIEWKSVSSERIAADQFPLLFEACRAALIVRWPGDHHIQFWSHRIDEILFHLLVNKHFTVDKPLDVSFFTNPAVCKSMGVNCAPILRPFLWDLLGWLAIHCDEKFSLCSGGESNFLNALISYTCSVSVDVVGKLGCIPHDLVNEFEMEPAARALLLLIFSPCKQIASQTHNCLLEALKPHGSRYMELLVHSLEMVMHSSVNGAFDQLRVVIALMSLASCSNLSPYQDYIIQCGGPRVLSSIIRKHSSAGLRISRSSIVSHTLDKYDSRTCCSDHRDGWEGMDIILFFAMCSFAELAKNSDFLLEIRQTSEVQCSLETFLDLLNGRGFGSGVQWFVAHILRCFGMYGFPSKFGSRVRKQLNVDKYADLRLMLPDGEYLQAHKVILAARCPLLLVPTETASGSNKSRRASCADEDLEQLCTKFSNVVRLSSRVHGCCMKKLMEFAYTGFVEVDHDHVKHLKILAKLSNLQTLTFLLSGKRPKWGSAVATCDFSSALESAGHPFFDIILVPQMTGEETCNCIVCQDQVPHVHAHKTILLSSCDYLRALFQSGMQDSSLEKITVPICWGALVKLVKWFYSGELPLPYIGCLWNNMDVNKKLQELKIYVELSWLAGLWFLEDVEGCSLHVIKSCLMSNPHLGVGVMQMASELAQWNIVELAADYIAPLYPKMRNQGELDVLDEALLNAIRSSYVRLSLNDVS
ncbi:BTB/POZ domain-containing protein At1g04390 isoform X2 [Nymphaea colorata]|uniref:BTB/POZ domain-containing protein At1g04390 isoform X2 n=1 Tax=Nymphaea colorata TaxID=210225 RepID=UPI00129DA073|nr:BTB/POZ domain-containing protein At1g04390 isoform X2 [Nymphaea colorata]